MFLPVHILGVLLMAWYFLTPVLFSIDIVAARPTEGLLLLLPSLCYAMFVTTC